MSRAARQGSRLSATRVSLALLLLAALVAAAVVGFQGWASARLEPRPDPWFAGYVDVTATPTFEFEAPAGDSTRDVMLSFIVADAEDSCVPTWGTAYTLDEAAYELDLDRRIARLVQAGGSVSVSFGGLNNDELASVCTDHASLVDAYEQVLDRYSVTTIDLDIEGDDLRATEAGTRRATALAEVQDARRAAGQELAVWLTLPVATSGLTEEGTDAIAQMLDAGVDLAGVNVMTMNFGKSLDDGETMGEASIRALKETHRQLGALYRLAGTELRGATLWSKIGATPMVGQNDAKAEVFDFDDAHLLNTFTLENAIGRVSMWSLNRDTSCGPNYTYLTQVSDACSGIDQEGLSFADVLAQGMTGRPALSAGVITTEEPMSPEELVDDPATSPYAIWAKDSSYLAGTKVVWHRNVYQAKWWTRGEVPDNPVLNAWETPWTLIGPVLPGEEPVALPTLAYGVFDEWQGTTIYDKGNRVSFEGAAYEAKWWTQGDSPAAFSSDPDGSAWAPLTADEVAAISAGGAGDSPAAE